MPWPVILGLYRTNRRETRTIESHQNYCFTFSKEVDCQSPPPPPSYSLLTNLINKPFYQKINDWLGKLTSISSQTSSPLKPHHPKTSRPPKTQSLPKMGLPRNLRSLLHVPLLPKMLLNSQTATHRPSRCLNCCPQRDGYNVHGDVCYRFFY